MDHRIHLRVFEISADQPAKEIVSPQDQVTLQVSTTIFFTSHELTRHRYTKEKQKTTSLLYKNIMTLPHPAPVKNHF